jgi:hypothetical protein
MSDRGAPVRAVIDYNLRDWARLDPLVHGFKRVRNAAIERVFRHRRPDRLAAFVREHASACRGSVAFTIAYNAPWVIDLLTRLAPLELRATLVVCDNSRDREARRLIERLCGERGIPYIALPFNPERHPCRSHGLAMNWAWYNLVRAWRPKVVAYLDHDLMPLEPVDPASRVVHQPVYGVLNRSEWAWNLWAGYCMYDVGQVDAFDPDFNHDVPRRLDTGGRNFERLYRHLDLGALRFPDNVFERIRDPGDGREYVVNVVDRGWLHIGGVGFGAGRQAQGTPEFFRRLAERIAAGEPIRRGGPSASPGASA